jgi:hypothetical protein
MSGTVFYAPPRCAETYGCLSHKEYRAMKRLKARQKAQDTAGDHVGDTGGVIAEAPLRTAVARRRRSKP